MGDVAFGVGLAVAAERLYFPRARRGGRERWKRAGGYKTGRAETWCL